MIIAVMIMAIIRASVIWFMGEYYPCHSRYEINEKVKRYSSEKRAIRAAESVLEKCGHVRGYEIYSLNQSKSELVYLYPSKSSSTPNPTLPTDRKTPTIADITNTLDESSQTQSHSHSFYHLHGLCVEMGCFNSDGEVVEDTREPMVALFNTDVISMEDVIELVNEGEVEFSKKVVVVPRHVAENLADIPGVGTWEYSSLDNIAVCSECKYEHYLGAYHQYATKYCPNCGRAMEEVDKM